MRSLLLAAVATLALATLSSSAASASETVMCTGAEPFWGMVVKAKTTGLQAVLTLPDSSMPTALNDIELRKLANTPLTYARVYEATDQRMRPITATIKLTSNGQSCAESEDPDYRYDLILVTPEYNLLGCCRISGQ